jgi:glutamine amidotransferase
MIAVLDYGMGNIHSIVKALRLFHDDVQFTADANALKSCRALVLPGDGHFTAAMSHLRGYREEILREHVAQHKPLLGICIGFQVLFDNSDETDGAPGLVPGLGLVKGEVRRFRFDDPALRVPHMGWNTLTSVAGGPDYLNHSMYFIHSYRPQNTDPADTVTTTQYGSDRFASTVRKGSILATQYHPEKSDAAGLRLLKEWVTTI